MIIKFKNLGPIESGEIDFNDLKGINLIIGKNNTGKTYLSNLLYCYLKSKFQVTMTVFNFLKDFISEKLDGDIENFKQYNFLLLENDKKFGRCSEFGTGFDPDDTEIARAVYYLLWILDLRRKKFLLMIVKIH